MSPSRSSRRDGFISLAQYVQGMADGQDAIFFIAGDDAALGQAVEHLAAKRTGAADADEPTGLLTHHLAHDDGCWAFIDRFVSVTTSHDATRWAHAGMIFADAFHERPAS